jgi:hypothetical protein
MDICDRAKHALWQKANLLHDAKGYVADVQQNLVPGVMLDMIKEDFSQGSGDELARKMRAIHSSSALAANTFGRWNPDPSTLQFLEHSGFDSIRFEAKCPTGLGGTPPNLDVLLKRSDTVIGIESKMLEPLQASKKAHFSKSYSRDRLPQCEESWWQLLEEVRQWPPSRFDSAQIIKHYLGLRKQYASDCKVFLVYLFWKPLNAESIPEYLQHAEDIERFRREIPENGEVRFIPMDYLALWESWEKASDPVLANHARILQQRYCIEV